MRPIDYQNIFVLVFLAFIALCWFLGWGPQ
jgi:hypothetical protein